MTPCHNCDPEGVDCLLCIHSDRGFTKKELVDVLTYAEHIHVNNQQDDTCAQCGHFLTHPIHKRYRYD